MRIKQAAGVAVLLAAFAPVLAFAAGNVLLPDDSSGSGSNLGLIPVSPDDKNTEKTEPDVSPPKDIKKNALLPYTPAPAQKPAMQPKMQVPMAMGRPGQPPQIIQMPEIPSVPDSPDIPKPPLSLTVMVNDRPTWGLPDVTAAYMTLGIDKDKSPSLCALHYQGVLTTDQGSYLLDTGDSGHGEVHYDGVIKNAMINVTALCPIGTLPNNGGIVMQVGNHYALPLGAFMCNTVPAAQPHQVTLSYTGSSTGKCIYQ